eukprot:CAMPEP_0168256584 /NCGR_PEP_ID=MMETSP0141_2-20121125/5973_1 /TAXON_ID=44445 /ORGANISM="Pseudo-nitzschia australis, Strain 10249 10 AB" /LENGTH=110 /DNA_ID=CAMNT_0008193375 /DNA_START=446 /DNA_END=778 /DNA_ORIENTATION=-
MCRIWTGFRPPRIPWQQMQMTMPMHAMPCQFVGSATVPTRPGWCPVTNQTTAATATNQNDDDDSAPAKFETNPRRDTYEQDAWVHRGMEGRLGNGNGAGGGRRIAIAMQP